MKQAVSSRSRENHCFFLFFFKKTFGSPTYSIVTSSARIIQFLKNSFSMWAHPQLRDVRFDSLAYEIIQWALIFDEEQ